MVDSQIITKCVIFIVFLLDYAYMVVAHFRQINSQVGEATQLSEMMNCSSEPRELNARKWKQKSH